MSCTENLSLNRRAVLIGGASLAFSGLLPRTAVAGTRDPRFLLVVLRGGLDGLSLVAPTGDPDYQRLRGELALQAGGQASGAGVGLRLDSLFTLHPSMAFLNELYARRQALIAHAIATPYRGRSHFDGQDVLESGLADKRGAADGWLNRALGVMPNIGSVAPAKGLSLGAVVPLVMRGSSKVMTWAPPAFRSNAEDDSTLARLKDLYAHTDPALGKALADGLEIDRMSGEGPAPVAGGGTMMGGAAMQSRGSGSVPQPANTRGVAKRYRGFIDTAARAAKFLATPDGPRIGVLGYSGWDTHFNEGVVSGQLANKLGGLDAAIKTLHDGLGPVWKDTVIVFATEFGRTARTNGTNGTDHGTATASIVVGGAVNGGRVLADWPGLSMNALYEGRDLKPTMDIRGLFKGVLHDHVGIPARALGTAVFPGSMPLKPMTGLVV